MSNQNKGTIQGQRNSSVNPQGHGKDVEFSTKPNSELENRAKKSNTKI